MIVEDAVEQRRPAARQAEDEDRHRSGRRGNGRSREIRRRLLDHRFDRSTFLVDVVIHPRIHDVVAGLQRGKSFVGTSEIFEDLELREFDRRVILASLLHRFQLRAHVIEMVRFRRLLAHAHERKRCASKRRPEPQTGGEFLARFLEASVELQFEAAEIAHIRCVESDGFGGVHQRQCFRMIAQRLERVRERHQ